MVDHVLEPGATWTTLDGRPAHVDDRIDTPHKAIRRVAAHLASRRPGWRVRSRSRTTGTPPPRRPRRTALFTPADRDEARSRRARIRANRLGSLTDDRLDHSPGEDRSLGESAPHLKGPAYCADSVGGLS
ncbi:hypothetical protein [Streptomyces longisporus]